MPGVKVVTDNVSDIPSDLLAEYDIDVVPLEVRLGPDAEAISGMTPEEFWRRVRATGAMAETSAPAPGAFAQAFRRARKDGFDAVCCVTFSSELSSTYQAACLGAKEVEQDIAVRVIDSRWGTMAEGLLVLNAAEKARGTLELDVLCEAVLGQIATIQAFGTLDTLEYLRRGGRIGSARAFFGSLLSVKPVIAMRDGVIEGESRQRTRSSSLRYLADKVAAALPIDRLAVVHADAADLEAFLAMLAPVFPPEKTIKAYIGPVIGTHLGPGTVAVCFQRL
ncbi:MAG: DegV family protein [Acidimicrobiales bacterium]